MTLWVSRLHAWETDMFRRIVVPLDGSSLAETILPHVGRLAADSALEIELLAVVPSPPIGAVARCLEDRLWVTGNLNPLSDDVVSATEHALVADQEARISSYLEQQAQQLAANGPHTRTGVRVGDPATEIVRYADEVQADAIMMSTHGRTGLDGLLHGSVAVAVLRDSPRPVILLRPEEAAFAEQRKRPAEGGTVITGQPLGHLRP
jgi:nucleotide-binding universal stress UspA family protein